MKQAFIYELGIELELQVIHTTTSNQSLNSTRQDRRFLQMNDQNQSFLSHI